MDFPIFGIVGTMWASWMIFRIEHLHRDMHQIRDRLGAAETVIEQEHGD